MQWCPWEYATRLYIFTKPPANKEGEGEPPPVFGGERVCYIPPVPEDLNAQDEIFERRLNAMGGDGWEAIHFRPVGNQAISVYYRRPASGVMVDGEWVE